MLLVLALFLISAQAAEITPIPREAITPVPKTDVHEKEFNAMDTDGDGNVTFTEFLLSDRPYIEHMSEKFHQFDQDGDSTVTKEEFDGFFEKLDKERARKEKERQNFFRHMNRHPFGAPFFNDFFLRKQESVPAVNETGPSPSSLEFSSPLFI